MYLANHVADQGVLTTGRLMRRTAVAFSGDLAPFGSSSLGEFFDVVKNTPYHPDPKGYEFLQRPAITLARRGPGGDCDDKAICIGAYLSRRRIPFRFLGAGRFVNKGLHHTWTQGYLNGSWVDLDPTYQWNRPGERLGKWPKLVVIG